jgi:hypothetical protein
MASLLIDFPPQRLLRWLSLAALAVLVAPAVLTVSRGRAGLPADVWSGRLDFVSAIAEGTAGNDRVLIVGLPSELPGSARAAGSVAFRLVDGSRPTLEQAYLPGMREGDRALGRAIIELAAASSLRPGTVLGRFGVSWVFVSENTGALDEALGRQIDLSPILVDPSFDAYENRSPSPRAVTTERQVWVWDGRRYLGPASPDRLRMADNADPGWTPEWEQVDWANSISADRGQGEFPPQPLLRGAAIASGVVVILMAGLAWWGRTPRLRPSLI